MQCAECRDALDAFLDDELAPDQRERVNDHLAGCAACARRSEELADISRRIEEGLVHHRAPDVLKARIRAAIAEDAAGPPPRSRWHWLPLAAAGVLIAAASSAATLLAVRRAPATDPVATAVLESHVRSLLPGHLLDVASNNQHNVKPWFDGRIDLSPPVPALDSAGFRLAGGRLDYVASHPAAVVVYARRQHVINVYSWAEPAADAPPVTTESHGYHLVYWRSGGVEFWAVSDLNVGELSQLVALLRR
jgi:anti-sigma factor RsiW